MYSDILDLVEIIVKSELLAQRRERLHSLGYDDIDIDFITGEGVGLPLGCLGFTPESKVKHEKV